MAKPLSSTIRRRKAKRREAIVNAVLHTGLGLVCVMLLVCFAISHMTIANGLIH